MEKILAQMMENSTLAHHAYLIEYSGEHQPLVEQIATKIGVPAYGVVLLEVAERQIKTVRAALRGLSTKAPYPRLFVIPGAHLLAPEVGATILKTLEEPPAEVYFLLFTPNRSGVLETVRSRCQMIKGGPALGRSDSALPAFLALRASSRRTRLKAVEQLSTEGDTKQALQTWLKELQTAGGQPFIKWGPALVRALVVARTNANLRLWLEALLLGS